MLESKAEIQSIVARCQAAAQEKTLSGALRRRIHALGQPVSNVAADTGVDEVALGDWLEGTAPLPSDAMDRLARAVSARVVFEESEP
jgi:hypothetical protein